MINIYNDDRPEEVKMQEIWLAERSLKHFIRQAWAFLEPKTSLIWGWHLDAICEHLEAISRGEIRKLIINIPPRHTKSLAVSVMWPCWEWIDNPGVRWLFSSYSQDLSTRDSVKSRRLIQSPWYQNRWSDKFHLAHDQNQKMRFENNFGGYRLSSSTGGLGTGEGGDRICVDDPHNVKDVESATVRVGTLLWWDEVMSTRANDPKRSCRVIIMQRSHENDLTGHILEKEDIDYVHLCLPARYEPDNLLTKTPLKFTDPRTTFGEPLCEERYGDKELNELEAELGEYASAGQLQQTPHPRGGGMFKIENFVTIDRKEFIIRNITASVRYWDKAASSGTEADTSTKRTAGVLMHKMKDGTFVVEDVVKGKWSPTVRERIIKNTAEIDGKKTNVWVEQEPGSGGKESAEGTIRNLAGYIARADRVTGTKEVRADQYSAQVGIQNVFLIRGSWVSDFIKEHESFPTGKYSDQVDAASGSFNKLFKIKKAGTWGKRSNSNRGIKRTIKEVIMKQEEKRKEEFDQKIESKSKGSKSFFDIVNP